jgi:hypothetical protein
MKLDKRAFAAIDVGYLDNPKISDVLDASSIALIMHVASILYCAQHSTDGEVAIRTMQRKAGGSEVDSQLLIDAGLWHVTGHECDSCPEVPTGKAYVHDFLRHNRSSEAVKGKSAKASAAANVRWGNKPNAMQDAMRNASETQCSEDESAMHREIDREKENLTSEVANAKSRPDVFDLLDKLDRGIESNGLKKPNRTKKNIDAMRLLLDRDGYNAKQVAWIINWASNNEFWRANILSASKLREKFNQLLAQSDRDQTKINGANNNPPAHDNPSNW